MKDIKSRLANRVQLTSDGFGAYKTAVEIVFQGEVDYAQLVKIYGATPNNEAVILRLNHRRYESTCNWSSG